MHRVEVRLKKDLPDPRGLALVKDIHDLGISTVSEARIVDIYWLDGQLDTEQLELAASRLFADPVSEEYWYGEHPQPEETSATRHSLEIAYNAGVTDPVEASILKALKDLGIDSIRAVKTARKYLLQGKLNETELDTIAAKLLVNPIIQHVVKTEPLGFPDNPQYQFQRKEIALERVRKEFPFDEAESRTITDYFQKLGRNPTDVELETLAQTWSEHCVHKTFKAKIRFNGEVIDSLIKSTIMKATRELKKPWCLSVFADNAGVIEFDDRLAVCFKVETHNHPSAIEPYGGAATGLGGVVRDPLGTGLGAKPILNTDVFCFAPPDFPHERLPKGVLHPRRIFKGVRAGVADYGNRLGIPTLNGAVLFDEGYLANPLVFCGTVGIMPRELAQRGEQKPGDLVVLVGGRTGRDGIHGVTFASEQLTEASSSLSFSAVQIGNAIVEKKMIDTLLQARDRRLYSRITDVGGGGLSSAVGEMGETTGVRVYLDRVPLKYAGLSYAEIWVSESQERMILAVPPEKADELIRLFKSEDVEAVVIGEFTDDHKLSLLYQGNLVGDLTMEFLHQGIPQVKREASWTTPEHPEPDFPCPTDLGDSLLGILGSWNVSSKEWVIRQYDHEVQGASVLKPLVGKDNDGPGDAAIVKPLFDANRGIIVSCGINPRYAEIDPYWMAASVIDEALRQVIAVGGDLSRVALLDNFCWGDAQDPQILGALIRAARACHDLSLAYETPFISGKDSLYNTFEADGRVASIPHTLLISAIAVMDDINRAVTMDFKEAGNIIYIVGSTQDELGGSEYYKLHGFIGNNVPKVDPPRARHLMERLSQATGLGLVHACHDLSDGGLGVAAAEMAFAGGLGAMLHLKGVPLGETIDRDDHLLFSESNSRFLVEIAPGRETEFREAMHGVTVAAIGQVTDTDRLEVYGRDNKMILSRAISELKAAWQKPLRW